MKKGCGLFRSRQMQPLTAAVVTPFFILWIHDLYLSVVRLWVEEVSKKCRGDAEEGMALRRFGGGVGSYPFGSFPSAAVVAFFATTESRF